MLTNSALMPESPLQMLAGTVYGAIRTYLTRDVVEC
jgi:hypothetical protein